MNRIRSDLLSSCVSSYGVGAASLLALAALLVAWLLSISPVSAQPPYPIIYEGTATIAGNPAPDGTKITATVGRARSRPTEVKDGHYALLVVDPSLAYESVEDVAGLVIEFFADGVRAAETDVFKEGQFLEFELDLNFPELPNTGDEAWGSLWLALGGGGAASVVAGLVLLALWPRLRGGRQRSARLR